VHPSPVIKLDNALQMCFLEREFILLCITVAYQRMSYHPCYSISFRDKEIWISHPRCTPPQ
jgi:hypothetical protein